MPLPSITPATPTILKPEPLTPAAFEQFGAVIASPLHRDVTSYPTSIPNPIYQPYQPLPILANQATALKTSPISPLTNIYPARDAANINSRPSSGLASIFSSFPRQNTYIAREHSNKKPELRVKLGILERHPYTTQTFCPFDYSASPETTKDHKLSSKDKTYMLVIVAPTIPNSSSDPSNPPDLSQVRAFIAPLNDDKASNKAVTYAPGTWHAPMIVLGSRRVDFLVTQFANGVPEDDCQEVIVGSGPDRNVLSAVERQARSGEGPGGSGLNEVEVDVSFLLEGREGEVPVENVQGEGWITDEAISRTVNASRAMKL